jgi:threonine dehydratase
MKIFDEILKAENRIRKFIRKTPLIPSPFLSKICECNVYLKLESEQITGSFKIRGAFNKILSLQERDRNVITASTGNHGIAVGYSSKVVGAKSKVVVPHNISEFKLKKLKEFEIDLEFYGYECVEAEYYAKRKAREEGLTYISPYNDLQIIAGQGTIGVELREQLGNFDSVLVPVGGGGMISGISVFLKSIDPNLKIFGCLPENSPVMRESIREGRIISIKTKETLSDATAGGIEEGSITFEICKKYVDDFFLVSEKEIEDSILMIYERHKKMIEGAGVLPVATLLKLKEAFKNQNVILVLSGSNIDERFFRDRKLI